jgi:hypothetical protein
MRTRLGAKRSKGGSPCEYLQRRMACISSLVLNEPPTQDTRYVRVARRLTAIAV